MPVRKRIGIVAKIQSSGTVGITAPYFDYFTEMGDVILINPLSRTVEIIDLLVLPGGPDLRIQRDAVPSARTGQPDVFLEYFDEQMLNDYIDAEVPVFGICRGMQAINALYGGTIVQHKRMDTSSYRWDLIEDVLLTDDNTFKVNSLHHQAVMPDDLADELVSIATSKKHGNIEALHHADLPIFGVQWHPEELYELDKASYFVQSKLSAMLGV